MKRILCLLAILQFCITGWSQTMTIDFKDGSTQKISMNDIKAITFTQDDEQTEVSIVGVWECTQYDYQTDFPEVLKDTNDDRVGERIYFNSDGTYSTSEETGKWTLKGSILTVVEDNKIPVDYKIEKLSSTELELSVDLRLFKYFYKFKRVS